MNYHNPRLLDRLAADYVLGTLRGPARRRFAGIAESNLVARSALVRWEGQLAPLALQLAPVAPPPHVWRRIEERLNLTHKPAAGRGGFWPALAAAAAMVAIGLGAYLLTREPEVSVQVQLSKPSYVAVFASQEAQPLWVLNAYPQEGLLRAVAVAAPPLSVDKSYELWMLPKDGSAPVSLGLLPTGGEAHLPLNERLQAILASSNTLAVSLEPAGGSPTGAPTGPVLYTAPLARAS